MHRGVRSERPLTATGNQIRDAAAGKILQPAAAIQGWYRKVRFRGAAMLGLPRQPDRASMSPLTHKAASAFAGNEVAARFSAPLLSYFLRRVRDRAQAEDLVQDALLRVIRAAESEVIEHPESYVFKVAANLLKDSRRHAVRHPTVACAALEENNAGEVDETL